MTAFKNEIHNVKPLAFASKRPPSPTLKEATNTVFPQYSGNSPDISSKRRETELFRGCLSEQKENNLRKITHFAAYQKINNPQGNPNKLYFPLSSPNQQKYSINSPVKPVNFKEKDESSQKTSTNTQNSNQKPAKPLQKNPSKSKFINSFKQFSDELLSSTTNFINSNLNKMSDRKQCSCDMGLGKHESCKTALKWLKTQKNSAKIQELKTLYRNLQKEPVDEKVSQQIAKDVDRTYATHEFFNGENSLGSVFF